MRRFISGLFIALPILGALTAAAPVRAQTNAGVLFLRIAAGARAAGMGEAFVAIADDATATHWNPAGLGVYPLNSEWNEHPMTARGNVLDAVAMKNGMPEDRFTGYDLWILTDNGLTFYSLGEPNAPGSRIGLPTMGVRSLDAALRRYARHLSEDQAETISRRAAAGTVGIPAQEVEELTGRVSAAMPDDYRDRTILENVIRELRIAHREGRIEVGQFRELQWEVSQLPETGPAEILPLDRVRVIMERSVVKLLPAKVFVDLNDLVPPPVRAIAGDGDKLYVAAANGLLVFDGSRWDEIDPPDGVTWKTVGINCLTVASGLRLWVGTNDGIYILHSGQWQKMGVESGLPASPVRRMLMSGTTSGWVLTDDGLARYEDQRFSTTIPVIANVGDSLTTMLGRFLGIEDNVYLAEAARDIIARDNLPADFVPEAGTAIGLPYARGFRGEVTAMATDSYGRRWVGTNLGAFRFARERWHGFGYRAVHVTEATTAQALAEEHLRGRATPQRVELLAEYIRGYNNLSSDNIPAGRTVYIYQNAAARRVNAFGNRGDILLIATEVGQLEMNAGQWARYYHAGLDGDQVGAILTTGDDVWFVTNDHIVVYQHPHEEINLMHSPWLPAFELDLYYDYGAWVKNFEGLGTVGLAITFLSYGEIPELNEYGELLNLFHSFDGALSLSYGTRLSHSLMAGLTAKVIYSRLAPQGAGEEIGSGSATAFALDAGFLYRTPWKRLTLGAAVTNVGPNISYIDAQQSDPLPRNMALGFSYKLWDSPFNRFVLQCEINKELIDLTESASEELKQIIYNVGFEYSYASMVAIRAGYVHDEDGKVKVPTVGGGLAYRMFNFDFAYIWASRDDTPLANTVRYSLALRF
ncbi:MAG TPA: PorV/PorQ family protein [Acidobacteriota bacterium]|nr:PorV/PorQ family protein [Acidobacteriota bacterium]